MKVGVSVGDGNLKNFHVQFAPQWVCSSILVGCETLIREFLNEQRQLDESTDTSVEENDLCPSKKLVHYNYNDICVGIGYGVNGDPDEYHETDRSSDGNIINISNDIDINIKEE